MRAVHVLAAVVVACALAVGAHAQQTTFSGGGLSLAQVSAAFLALTGGTVSPGPLNVSSCNPASTGDADGCNVVDMAATAASGDKARVTRFNGTTVHSIDRDGNQVNAGNLAVRGEISGGGASACDGVGTTGAACVKSSTGLVVSTGATASQAPLTVKAPAVSASPDVGLVQVFGETSNAWMTLMNGVYTTGQVGPTIFARAIGQWTGINIIGGTEAASDTASAAYAAVTLDARREAGTPTSPSGSAITARPTHAFTNLGTKLVSFNVNGAIGQRHISPTALSGDVDNYAGCTTTGICRIDGGASSRNITGIVPTFNSAWDSSMSEFMTVCAVGSNNLVLKHDVTSTTTNRFTFNGGTDRTILAGSCMPLLYDRTSQRWRAANGT